MKVCINFPFPVAFTIERKFMTWLCIAACWHGVSRSAAHFITPDAFPEMIRRVFHFSTWWIRWWWHNEEIKVLVPFNIHYLVFCRHWTHSPIALSFILSLFHSTAKSFQVQKFAIKCLAIVIVRNNKFISLHLFLSMLQWTWVVVGSLNWKLVFFCKAFCFCGVFRFSPFY